MATFSSIKGSWAITANNAEDVMRQGEIITGVREVFMLRFPVGEAIRPGATTFGNAFDADSHIQVFNEATMQLFLKAAADLRVKYDELMRNPVFAGGCQGDPLIMCLECVVGADQDPMLVADGLHEPANLHTRPFLTGIPDSYPIVEYRIFFFLRYMSDSINFGRVIAETISATKRRYAQQFAGVKLRKGKKGEDDGGGGGGAEDAAKDDDVDLCSYTGDHSGSTQYGMSLKDMEKYMLIRSEITYCNAADLMLGYKHLTRPEVMQSIISKPLTNDINPAHPRYVFSPYTQFKYPNQNGVYEQIDLRSYVRTINGETCWTFPVANRVVRVPADDQMISRFRTKFLPDYQVRNLGDRLEYEAPPPLRRFNATYWNRIGQADDREMVENQIDPDGDVAGNNAVIPGGGADVDENGNVIGQNAAAIPIAGGTTQQLIRQMTSQILPKRDEIVEYDSQTLLREDYEDSTTLQAQNLLTITDDPNRSAFHMLRYRGAQLKMQLTTLVRGGETDRDKLRQMMLANQQRMFRDYDDMCMSRTSDISRPGKIINAWFHKRRHDGNAWLGQETPKMDGNLSTLANILARRAGRYEAGMYMANAHALAITMSFGSLDAYRHELNLHFNMAITGTHATGKSFTADLLRYLRIPGTVVLSGAETDKAGFTDTYHNDEIQVCHELRPDMFKKREKGGDENKEAAHKEACDAHARILRGADAPIGRFAPLCARAHTAFGVASLPPTPVVFYSMFRLLFRTNPNRAPHSGHEPKARKPGGVGERSAPTVHDVNDSDVKGVCQGQERQADAAHCVQRANCQHHGAEQHGQQPFFRCHSQPVQLL